MKREKKERAARLLETVGRFKYVIVLLLFGVFLLLLPGGSGGKSTKSQTTAEEPRESFSCAEEEARLQEVLSLVDGAGKVRVLLTVADQGERVVASDRQETADRDGGDGDGESRRSEEKTVVVSTGSGTEDAVTLKTFAPAYRGAVVVAEGADSPSVCLALTEAVAAATGLGWSSIKVVRMG